MAQSYFSAPTIDDTMQAVITEIINAGEQIEPREGSALELRGVLAELTNPRARLSKTETRGMIFSCLGELCWYLSGSNNSDFITYYIRRYEKYAEDGVIYGGYGPRLFASGEFGQLRSVIRMTGEKTDSRRMVVQIFDADDLVGKRKEIPCTCTLQLMKRRGTLDFFTSMRSNDAFAGLLHDTFCFTMIQELAARELGLELGTYKHAVGSMHLYNSDREKAEQFLNEGWQSTEPPMPSMPHGDQWENVRILLAAEKSLRETGIIDRNVLTELDPYWADLVRLLDVYRAQRDEDYERVRLDRDEMIHDVYRPYIDAKLWGKT